MKIELPQIIYIVLVVLSLAYNLKMDGRKRIQSYSFMSSVISTMIMVWILWAGGFFTY